MTYQRYEEIESQEDSNQGDKKFKLPEISPLFIHISLLLLLLIIVAFFFFSDFNSNKDNQTIIILGDLEDFNKSFIGDLEIETSKYTLKTPDSVFDGDKKQFQINGFNGEIILLNKTIFFKGNAKNISFDKNTIKLNDKTFSLSSSRKTTTNFFLDEINLDFLSGTIKYSNSLNYKLKNTSIILKEFNTSMTFDKSFSFRGLANSFELIDNQKGLNINYNKPSQNN